MIKFRQEGNFTKTTRYFKRIQQAMQNFKLDQYGKRGVAALASATPVDTGLTASSWYYQVSQTKNGIAIEFCNSNRQNGVPIAIILQYGHGTGTGGWVEGRDYINPAIQPIFDEIAADAWKEVGGQ